jgi:putative oxidoreductase
LDGELEARRVKNLKAFITTSYRWFVKAVSGLQSPFLLLVRVYWGWQLAANGWGKLHNLPHVTVFFASLGLPAPGPTATFVSLVEFLGGILLALGLFSRITALAITIDMFMAYITADREAFFSFISDPDKFTGAAPYVILFAGLLILIFGPGKISMDYAWNHYLKKSGTG